MLLGFCLANTAAYIVPRDKDHLLPFLPLVGFFSGVFGLFTMYLPPLFPTLLRTTGAGFCYNIGRIFAAAGTVFFVLINPVGDMRLSLIWLSPLFLMAMCFALTLPDQRDRDSETVAA